MKRNIAPLLFGIVFILAGVAYLGSTIFGWNIDIFFDGWWTLFIIIPTFISILSNGPHVGSVVGFFIGIIFLLSAQDIIQSRYVGYIVVSAAIVAIGVSLIANFFRGPKQPKVFVYNTVTPPSSPDGSAGAPNPGGTDGGAPGAPGGSGGFGGGAPGGSGSSGSTQYTTYNSKKYVNIEDIPFPNHNAVLSGLECKNISKAFEGARLSAVLGGIDYDLSEVQVNHDITIYVTAILGGVDIVAPRNVKIEIRRTDILGGTDCNAYTMPRESSAPVCTFVTTTVLGGVDIK